MSGQWTVLYYEWTVNRPGHGYQDSRQGYYTEVVDITKIKGESKKTLPNLRNSVCLISLATNMIDGWDVIHLKS